MSLLCEGRGPLSGREAAARSDRPHVATRSHATFNTDRDTISHNQGSICYASARVMDSNLPILRTTDRGRLPEESPQTHRSIQVYATRDHDLQMAHIGPHPRSAYHHDQMPTITYEIAHLSTRLTDRVEVLQ